MPNLVQRGCGYCDETGVIEIGDFVPERRSCPVCRGAGTVRVYSDSVSCRVCNGTGRVDIGEFVPELRRCDTCKGTGWVRTKEYR